MTAAPGQRGCVLLVALVWHLALRNQAPTSVCFAQTHECNGEQGASIPFLWPGARWLGWLWPHAAPLYVLVRAPRKDAHP